MKKQGFSIKWCIHNVEISYIILPLGTSTPHLLRSISKSLDRNVQICIVPTFAGQFAYSSYNAIAHKVSSWVWVIMYVHDDSP